MSAHALSSVPLIIRETSRGTERLDIYDDMLKRRELALVGEVEPSMVHALCQHVRRLEALDHASPITLFVDSPGGDVGAGLALFDVLRSVSCPIRTVCPALAASMGAVVFLAGDEREMYPHAELVVHDPLIAGDVGKGALGVQETSRRLMSVRKTLNSVIAERSGLSPARIERLTRKATYIDAASAIELGLATAITRERKGGF